MILDVDVLAVLIHAQRAKLKRREQRDRDLPVEQLKRLECETLAIDPDLRQWTPMS
jgi:hypothetical protein